MATITWQNVNAPDSRDAMLGTAMAANSIDTGFEQLGQAIGTFGGINADQENRKVTSKLLDIQSQQRNAIDKYRQDMAAITILPGVAGVDSMTGKVKVKSDAQIGADYTGPEEGRAAFIANARAEATAKAAEFFSTPKGILSSKEFNNRIRDVGILAQKDPNEIKALQESLRVDPNEGIATTEMDKLNNEAVNTRFLAEAANMDLQHKTELDLIKKSIKPYEDQVITPYANLQIDDVLKSSLTGEGWNDEEYERTRNNFAKLEPAILQEIDADGSKFNGKLPSFLVAEYVKNNPISRGENTIWGWLKGSWFADKELKDVVNDDRSKTILAAMRNSAAKYNNYLQVGLDISNKEKEHNVKKAQQLEHRSNYLHLLKQQQNAAAGFMDPNKSY